MPRETSPQPTPEDLFGRVHDIDWREKAACAGLPVELFVHTSPRYAPTARKVVQAVAICDACPVKDDCLTEAFVLNEKFGIWGGKTPGERKAIAEKKLSTYMLKQSQSS